MWKNIPANQGALDLCFHHDMYLAWPSETFKMRCRIDDLEILTWSRYCS